MKYHVKVREMVYCLPRANAKLQSPRTESCPTSLALIVDHRVINNVLKDSECSERELLSEERFYSCVKKKKVNSSQPRPNLSYKRLHIFSFVLFRLRECLVSFLQFVVACFFCQKVLEAFWDHLKVYAEH